MFNRNFWRKTRILIALLLAGFSFSACEVVAEISSGTSSSLSPSLISLTEPLNGQIVTNGFPVSGSYFDRAGLTNLVVFVSSADLSIFRSFPVTVSGTRGNFTVTVLLESDAYSKIWVSAVNSKGNETKTPAISFSLRNPTASTNVASSSSALSAGSSASSLPGSSASLAASSTATSAASSAALSSSALSSQTLSSAIPSSSASSAAASSSLESSAALSSATSPSSYVASSAALSSQTISSATISSIAASSVVPSSAMPSSAAVSSSAAASSSGPSVGLTVHFKNTSAWGGVYIYAWTNAGVTAVKLAGEWPGKALAADGNGWFSFTLTNVSNCNLIFNNNSDSMKTADLSRSNLDGWYKSGAWYNSNPDETTPPTVSITSPWEGASLVGTNTFAADASDASGIAKVEFWCDNTKIGETNAAPYSIQWDSGASANGSHTIRAIAFDVPGNVATNSRGVSTSNPNRAPVAIAGGPYSVMISNALVLNGSASYDPNGSVASWAWSCPGAVNSSLSGSNATVQYNASGSFNVTLTVTDNEGATGATNVTVNVVTNVIRSDFREESVYFVMTARFYDGDSANNRYGRSDYNSGNYTAGDPSWRGDFKGLIQKLDYIKALGFTAIWITPPVMNRSDMDYHGYHAWDMTKIDPRLESSGATYQDFINACHAKGMKVMQDIVLNHSSRYGEKNLGKGHFWGDSADSEWGDGTAFDYYDVPNPNFEYDGLSVEPVSGKNYYNGDVYEKDCPSVPWYVYTNCGGIHHTDPNTGKKAHNWQFLYDDNISFQAFDPHYYHTNWLRNWEDYTCQLGSIHGDCVDLDTESADTQNFLINTYNRYIDMGVDSFRIDTAKHISRVMFNRHFLPAFKQRGGSNFYMVGEALTKVFELWNKNVAPLSAPFYTWKERSTFSSDDHVAAKEGYDYENGQGTGAQPTSQNAFLSGNNYHDPDYSQNSGLSVIDFHQQANYSDAGSAFGARDGDQYYNDATYNLCYVDSHDYGPSTTENRATCSEAGWAENMSLLWTFRGIPCLFYGSEIQFKAGGALGFDPNKLALKDSGRAYYGDNIEGSVTTSDFGVYSGATGAMASTLNSPLAKHLAKLNRIRRAVPALQKGQYSTEGCSGGKAFKRRYTKGGVDSFALVTISGGSSFTGLPAGTYKDVVTGDTQSIGAGGTVNASCSGQGNIRVYVLNGPGQIAADVNDPYIQ